MIGLPFETEEDIDAIIGLIKKIIARSGKRLQINVTISPFVPKSHTPFQWAGLGQREELIRKATKIKFAFSKQNFVKIKYHDVESLLLEAVIGRGDRSISQLIFRAYQKGALYDGWQEYFDFIYWQSAAEELELDLDAYVVAKDLQADLIWDHIDLGIRKEFLQQEWQKAAQSALTEDCREGDCSACGVCHDQVQNRKARPISRQEIVIPPKVIPDQIQSFYYRVYYQKMKRMRFVAHLDLLRMTHRFMRVAQIPLAYSQGFNPHPRISFGPPLPVGVEGEKEYFVFAMTEKRPVQDLAAIFQLVMPQQLQFMGVEAIASKQERAMDFLNLELTEVYPTEQYWANLSEQLERYHLSEIWEFSKLRKRKERRVNLKNIIKSIEITDNVIKVKKEVIGASIFDILASIFAIPRSETAKFRIIRKGFYRE
jgi:radical SAM-linked protein